MRAPAVPCTVLFVCLLRGRTKPLRFSTAANVLSEGNVSSEHCLPSTMRSFLALCGRCFLRSTIAASTADEIAVGDLCGRRERSLNDTLRP